MKSRGITGNRSREEALGAFPTLAGDFFTYADRYARMGRAGEKCITFSNMSLSITRCVYVCYVYMSPLCMFRDDHYWSGYFTSRPFHKHMDRVLGYHLRYVII